MVWHPQHRAAHEQVSQNGWAMSTTLHQHGRSITGGFTAVEHHQGADCGELVSSTDGEGPDDDRGLSRQQQIGIALALLVLLVGGGVAVGRL